MGGHRASLKPRPPEGGLEDAQIPGNANTQGGDRGQMSSGGIHLRGLAKQAQWEKSGGPGRWSVMIAGQARTSSQGQHTEAGLRLMTWVTMEGWMQGQHRRTPPSLVWSLCRGAQGMEAGGQLGGCEVIYLGHWKRKGGLFGIYFGSLAHRGRKLTFCGTLTDMREVGRVWAVGDTLLRDYEVRVVCGEMERPGSGHLIG